ncbi:MAG TPA: hypothetical protein VF197_05840 [Methylomirabilota bacterium]|jgi:hypothetical protein
MRTRTALPLIVLIGVGIFAALNWSAFTTPTPLSLGLWRTEAPLGLTLLAVIAAITLLYIGLVLWIQASALLEARRTARELLTQRQLAESAEASRFEELRRLIETELQALRAAPTAEVRPILDRLEQAEAALRADIERAGNTLAAYIGELEERLSRNRPDTR